VQLPGHVFCSGCSVTRHQRFFRLLELQHAANTRATLCAHVLAHLAHALAHRVGKVEAHSLAWATNRTGRLGAEQLTQVRVALDADNHTTGAGRIGHTLATDVLALLAVELGADRGGDVHQVLDVLGGALGPTWALVELRLGIVRHTLVGADKKLTSSRAENNAALAVQETRVHRGRHL